MFLLAAGASAHARVSPPVSLSGELQLYSLAVPTEKSNLTTSKIVMTVPAGPESSAAPAPTIEAKSSLGGGSVSVLTIIALIVGLLALAAGGFALVGGSSGKRSLA
jgi:uncharacterized protein YcnI